MPDGLLSVVLHAHLPYVRHPEHETFLEEQWFFEALTETYIPLLRMLERLEDDGVEYSLLVSLSPTLVAMFEDELLQERYAAHLRKLIVLAGRETERTAGDARLNRLAHWYVGLFRDALYWYEEKFRRRPAAAFQRLAALGNLELMTCGATHGFLPILKDNPGAVRAQVFTATEYHERVFGVAPQGLWVPECAYYPGLEDVLHAAGIRYFFVDAHCVENAAIKAKFGVYAPVYAENGVAAFARDKETSYQVWAAEVGYPGHADYREFYRDIGYDLDEEYLRDFLIDGRVRVNTGIKYHRITRDGQRKDLYDPDRARERAAEHAGNFVFNRERQIEHLRKGMDRPPLVVSPYDAELFGHWWFEGPLFLDYVFRKLCYDQQKVKSVTPAQYLRLYPENQVCQPAGGSWGHQGTYEYWINPSNDAIIRDLHRAADRLTELVSQGGADAAGARVLKQMTRELLLAQASDWPFIMRTGTSPEYARKRVSAHLSRFAALEAMLANGVDEETLAAVEYVDAIFPDIRPEHYTAEV